MEAIKMSCPLSNDVTNLIKCQFVLNPATGHCNWYGSEALQYSAATKEGHKEKSKKTASEMNKQYMLKVKELAANGDPEAIEKLEKRKEINRIAKLKYNNKNRG